MGEFRSFIRMETGFFVSGIAVSGFLIFNQISWSMLFLALVAFFSSAAIYSYNHIKDKKEDLVNNRRINRFAAGKNGLYIILGCIFISFFCSLFLSFFSFIIYMASLSSGMLYSTFRIKRLYFIKNLYTGLVFSLVFLMGEVANAFSYDMLGYLLVPFLSGIVLNLLGDIRGYSGDKAAGLKTLPVILGTEKSKHVLHAVVWSLIFLAPFYYKIFISTIPFMVLLSFFLARHDMKITRACILLSFATMPFFILVVRWI
jgi:4-hydroxybenzoate polyprenyltransferase